MSTTPGTSLDDVFAVRLPPRPYPGLRPFEKDEWPIFFGRERMADAIVARLLEKKLLVVHGDSGCGKSSLVRAGVLPRLEQQSARGGLRWRTCSAMPREAPLWNLATALAGLDGTGRSEAGAIACRRALNFGGEAPEALAELLGAGPDDQVCILIDQFEELFDHARRHGHEEATLFTEILVGLLDRPPPGLHAVLTMRSEFLGACSSFPGFPEAVNATQYLVPRMAHADLLRAIREPAALYDGEISRELAERLIADGGGGQDQLPLIQHGLMLLHRDQAAPQHEAAAEAGPTWRLGLEHYHPAGGLAAMLSVHADAVQLGAERHCLPAERPGRVIEDIFRALTDINADGQAIRRPRTLGQLVAVSGADAAAVRCVLAAFRADGVSFLKPYGDAEIGADELIDVSHEALIRCWARLADPADGWLLREFRNGLVWRSLLVQADSFERNPANVLGASTTDERERWLQRRNPAWAERYGGGWERVHRLVAASADARDRRKAEAHAQQRQRAEARRREQRLRTMYAGLGVLALLLVVSSSLGYVAWEQSRRAAAELDEAKRQFEAAGLAREGELAARAQTEALAQEARQSAETLQRVASALEGVGAEASNWRLDPSAWEEQLSMAKAQIVAQADTLSSYGMASTADPTKAVRPAPAVGTGVLLYIHIAGEGQAAAARTLARRLQAGVMPVVAAAVTVPDIAVVKAAPAQSLLRCFQPAECRSDGKALLAVINDSLRAPRVTLDDVSARYGDSRGVRPGTYELWFAPGAIELAAP